MLFKCHELLIRLHLTFLLCKQLRPICFSYNKFVLEKRFISLLALLLCVDVFQNVDTLGTMPTVSIVEKSLELVLKRTTCICECELVREIRWKDALLSMGTVFRSDGPKIQRAGGAPLFRLSCACPLNKGVSRSSLAGWKQPICSTKLREYFNKLCCLGTLNLSGKHTVHCALTTNGHTARMVTMPFVVMRWLSTKPCMTHRGQSRSQI